MKKKSGKEVNGTHVLVMNSAEFYSNQDLQYLKEDIVNNPDADLFKFDFSYNPDKRSYYYLWHGFDNHIVGGYWNVPHNRIFKWVPGTKYTIYSEDDPIRPNGVILNQHSVVIKIFTTRAKCVHVGFANKTVNKSINNTSNNSIDECNELNLQSNKVNEMHNNSKQVWESWIPHMPMPQNTRIFPFPHKIPEPLIRHSI